MGVTRYPSLPPSRWLQGPANDVMLIRHLLREKFAFHDADIVTLAEGPEPAMLPTRGNIQRELDALKEKAQPGVAIVVYLSGHGSMAPHPLLADRIAPAASDTLFLPRDIGPWDGKTQRVANALSDRDLSDWAREVAGKGASLWLIVDSCHSGGFARETRWNWKDLARLRQKSWGSPRHWPGKCAPRRRPPSAAPAWTSQTRGMSSPPIPRSSPPPTPAEAPNRLWRRICPPQQASRTAYSLTRLTRS